MVVCESLQGKHLDGVAEQVGIPTRSKFIHDSARGWSQTASWRPGKLLFLRQEGHAPEMCG